MVTTATTTTIPTAAMHAASPSYDNGRVYLLCYTTASGDAHYFCYRDMDQRRNKDKDKGSGPRVWYLSSDFPRRLDNNALTYDDRVAILQFMIRELQARAREQQLQPVGPEGYTQQAEFNILLGEPHVLNTWRTALGVPRFKTSSLRLVRAGSASIKGAPTFWNAKGGTAFPL